MSNFPPNTVQPELRNLKAVRNAYDSGEVCDGHRLMRTDTGIEVLHPLGCYTAHEDGGWTVNGCPWAVAAEWEGGPTLLFDGLPGVDPADLLPLGEPVKVAWRYESHDEWTGHGWDGHAGMGWWLP